jgi:hypothetical protein
MGEGTQLFSQVGLVALSEPLPSNIQFSSVEIVKPLKFQPQATG